MVATTYLSYRSRGKLRVPFALFRKGERVVSLSAATSMFKEPKGCGQSGLILTLYLIRESGDIRALGRGFRLLPCGHFPRPHDPYSVGILLCERCAAACNLPKLNAASARA